MLTLHVDDGRTWRGGQAQVLLLLTGLAERGIDAQLVAPPTSPLLERARTAGLATTPLALRGEWDIASVFALRALLASRRADLVHAHTAHALTLAGMAGRWAGTRAIVAARRVDFPVSWVGSRKLNRLPHAVIAVSAEVRRVLVACGVEPARIEVVQSAVDTGAAPGAGAGESFRRALGLGRAPLVGTAGALVDHKDQRTLVEAARHLHNVCSEARVLIAGEGPLAGALARQIESLGLSGVVHLLGFRRDLPELLAALDVFVLCSHHEGLGTAVLDAMAAGVPVVATRAGGIPEMVEDRKTGLLVSPRDPRALAEAIALVLADRALARRLVENARDQVQHRFAAARMVEETLAIYRRLLGVC